jgi:hypothetical protein
MTGISETYAATVERGKRYWIVHVPGIDCYTQARVFSEAEPMALDLIATALNIDSSLINVDLRVIF